MEKRDFGISHHEKIPHLGWRMVEAMEGVQRVPSPHLLCPRFSGVAKELDS